MEPTFSIPGTIIRLQGTLRDVDGNLADPDLTIRLRIIDELGVERLDVEETIGALVNILNPSQGVYQYFWTVLTNDRTNRHLWFAEFSGTSSTPPAPTVFDDGCFGVAATKFAAA